jgi:hypothetical protein
MPKRAHGRASITLRPKVPFAAYPLQDTLCGAFGHVILALLRILAGFRGADRRQRLSRQVLYGRGSRRPCRPALQILVQTLVVKTVEHGILRLVLR